MTGDDVVDFLYPVEVDVTPPRAEQALGQDPDSLSFGAKVMSM